MERSVGEHPLDVLGRAEVTLDPLAEGGKFQHLGVGEGGPIDELRGSGLLG